MSNNKETRGEKIERLFTPSSEYFQEDNKSAGVWVKASDRNPEKENEYFIRHTITHEKEIAGFYPESQGWWVSSLEMKIDKIEWLDESNNEQEDQILDTKEKEVGIEAVIENFYQELNTGGYGISASDAHKLTLFIRKQIESLPSSSIKADNQASKESYACNDYAEWLELEGYRIKGMDQTQRARIYQLFTQSKNRL